MSAQSDKPARYITVCPTCKEARTDSRAACAHCNSAMIQTCITAEQFNQYTQPSEGGNPVLALSMGLPSISESYLTPLDEIVADFRNDALKKSKRVAAIKKLWLRNERDDYIPEIIPFLADPDMAAAAVYYLFVCTMSTDHKVFQYLKLEDLEGLKKLSRKTKLLSLAIPLEFVKELQEPMLLSKYAAGEACPCQQCGAQTKNVMIKIEPEKKLASSVRGKGNVIQNLYVYSAEMEISVICDDCVLKRVKRKRGKGKSDAELIKEYLHTNCIGGSLASFTHLSGYDYEFLIDLSRLPAFTPEADCPQEAFNAMCTYAREIRKKLEEM